MESRKDNLLRIIIEEYISSASPVGSGLVVDKYLPEVSSATVRNEMAELEADGLIRQPHTSAGRIPTIKGYRCYIDKFVGEGKLSEKDKKSLNKIADQLGGNDVGIKSLAKVLAELSNNAVLIGFKPYNVYYTGISNLFRQPEFVEQSQVYSMSEIIDHLDDVMGKIFNKINIEAQILLGRENPFGEMSSVILGKYKRRGQDSGLIGILGPSRMDYPRNLGLVRYAQEIIGDLK